MRKIVQPAWLGSQEQEWTDLGERRSGELRLGVLIEQMRREGFELCVSKPQVIFKKENGVTKEPFERATIDIEDTFVGVVSEKVS